MKLAIVDTVATKFFDLVEEVGDRLRGVTFFWSAGEESAVELGGEAGVEHTGGRE